MATFLKSHKSETAPPSSPPRTEWILAGPAESGCRLPWRCDKLIFHLNARCSEHWCKGYYPECPSGLANGAKAAHWATSKKWKVRKKTKYIYYFLLNGLPYHGLYTFKRKGFFVAAFFKVIDWQKCIINILDLDFLYKFYILYPYVYFRHYVTYYTPPPLYAAFPLFLTSSFRNA